MCTGGVGSGTMRVSDLPTALMPHRGAESWTADARTTGPGTPSRMATTRSHRARRSPKTTWSSSSSISSRSSTSLPSIRYYAQELRGQPPFDVTMMVTLLVYAYAVGIRSSRKIAAACERNLAFRAIVGDDRPDFRTISDFRKIHTGGAQAPVPRGAARRRRDGDGQAGESVHRRDQDGSQRLAAQGDELRLHGQGNRTAQGRDRPIAQGSRAGSTPSKTRRWGAVVAMNCRRN